MTEDAEVIENLKRSRQLVGELEEVLVDQDGNVIDGRHRLKAYPGWKTRTIQTDEKQALIIRLHRNYRRNVNKEETKSLLHQLALTLENEGVPTENIAQEIVKLSPYTEPYTLSLLHRKYKQPKKVKAAEATYKVLYPEQKETKTTATHKPEQKQKFLQCPVCGSRLILKGDLLFQAST